MKSFNCTAALHSAALTMILGLAPSQSFSQPDPTAASDATVHALNTAAWIPEPDTRIGANKVLVLENTGIVLETNDGSQVEAFAGQFETLDLRQHQTTLTMASIDRHRQQVMIAKLNQAAHKVVEKTWLPRSDLYIEGLCLYQDADFNTFAFLIGEEGQGEQWWIAHPEHPSLAPRKVRRLSLPPSSQHCSVDDASSTLYVNEESVGVWAYPASPEAELKRSPIALVAANGVLSKSALGLAALPNGLLVIDGEAGELIQLNSEGELIRNVALKNISDAESVSSRVIDGHIEVLVSHKHGTRSWLLSGSPKPLAKQLARPTVNALVETIPVESLGDAADDPAIWVSQASPTIVRILGTDKKRGLMVYDLEGRTLQSLPVGRLNNVDIRSGFNWNGQNVDLAVATNRDNNSLHAFAIHPHNGEVSEIGELPTDAKELYGLCMYRDKDGHIDAIFNDKDGRFFQYRLRGDKGILEAQSLRSFSVSSQPEGCVADDESGQLFIGEEAYGVWTLPANGASHADLQPVINTGHILQADVEGIALHRDRNNTRLVVSSQGNDSYVILDAKPPFKVLGHFSVSLNPATGIDGVSETDGLAVTSQSLGGPWSRGMLVVQDGRNRMPVENQNFKYVPWAAVESTLSPAPSSASDKE